MLRYMSLYLGKQQHFSTKSLSMRIYTLTISLLLITAQLSYGQLKRTTNQSITANKVASVDIEFDYETEIERWPGGHIQIQTTIEMTNGNRNILESLIKEKRYEVLIKENAGKLTLNYKEFKQGLRVGGYEVFEHITVKVFVPEEVQISINGTAYQEAKTDDADGLAKSN